MKAPTIHHLIFGFMLLVTAPVFGQENETKRLLTDLSANSFDVRETATRKLFEMKVEAVSYTHLTLPTTPYV